MHGCLRRQMELALLVWEITYLVIYWVVYSEMVAEFFVVDFPVTVCARDFVSESIVKLYHFFESV